MPSFSISTQAGDTTNPLIVNGAAYRTRITDATISILHKGSSTTHVDLTPGGISCTFDTQNHNHSFSLSPGGLVYNYPNNFTFNVNPGGITYNNNSNQVSFQINSNGISYSNSDCAFGINSNVFNITFDTYALNFINNSNDFTIAPTSNTKATYLQNIRYGFSGVMQRSDLSTDFKNYANTKDDLLVVLDELYTAVQDLESRVSALEGN